MNLSKIKKTSNNILLNNNAFTLIELLVGISILTIIILGGTNLNYNRLNNIQKLEIFTNNIKTDFEVIRNNALSGRGIGTGLNIPEKWKIEYDLTSSGKVVSHSFDGSSWTPYKDLMFEPDFYISKISCLDINGTHINDISLSGTGIIEIEGINLYLKGDCLDPTSKILELTVNYKLDKKIIQINTLNGLIEKKSQ